MEDYIEETNIGMTGKKAYSRIGFATAAFFVTWNVLVIVMQLVLINISDNITYTALLLVNTIVEVFAAAPVFFLVSKKCKPGKLKKSGMKLIEFLRVICVMYLFSIIGAYVSVFLNLFLDSTVGVTSESGLTEMFSNDFITMAIVSAVVAPVVEELIFRKLVIDKLHVYGDKMAVIMSGFLFGLAHGNLEQFFYTFLIGILLAYVYVNTGKIKYTIGLHFILNGVSVFLSYLLTLVPDEMLEADIDPEVLMSNDKSLFSLAVIGMVEIIQGVLAIIGIYILIKNRKNISVPDSVSRKKIVGYDAYNGTPVYEEGESGEEITKKDAFINPGMVTAVLILILMFFINMYL